MFGAARSESNHAVKDKAFTAPRVIPVTLVYRQIWWVALEIKNLGDHTSLSALVGNMVP